MNHHTTPTAPPITPGDGDVESFDGWSPASDGVYTCYTMAVESSAS